jgi:hypothetical protein
VTQPQTSPSETRLILTQHDNALAAVPVLEAHLNCKPVIFNRDKKYVLSITDQLVHEREKTRSHCADRGGLILSHTNQQKFSGEVV